MAQPPDNPTPAELAALLADDVTAGERRQAALGMVKAQALADLEGEAGQDKPADGALDTFLAYVAAEAVVGIVDALRGDN